MSANENGLGKTLLSVADDLTGAADSGSYFTNRGMELTIYTELEPEKIVLQEGKHTAVNLSTRNASPETAFRRHFQMFRKIGIGEGRIIMKKIGTGFRGRDAYELNGILAANEELICFIVDSAPDLGTFTLYGNQYCEGCILTKSLYANDPVMPPDKSYIPEILRQGTEYAVGVISIDVVKGKAEEIVRETKKQIEEGKRAIVFDAVTKEDGKKIVSALSPFYPNAVWTGSLGIADALAWYMTGREEDNRHVRCNKGGGRAACFTASAYDATKKQIAYSMGLGLKTVELDIDRIIEGNQEEIARASELYLKLLETGDVILVPKVETYSYKEGASKKILESVALCADRICRKGRFTRLAIIGGETAQMIFRSLDIHCLDLKPSPEAGTAIGLIQGGDFQGKEIALKGGSIGSIQALEYMIGK